METKTKNMPHEYYQFASFGERFAAIFIDGIVLVFIYIIVAIVLPTGDQLGNAISFGVGILYNWYFWTQKDGQTPGKSAMKIKVVKADGSPINNFDALVRYLGYTISSFIFCLGYLWMLWDEDKQTWHDKMASTYVVKADQ